MACFNLADSCLLCKHLILHFASFSASYSFSLTCVAAVGLLPAKWRPGVNYQQNEKNRANYKSGDHSSCPVNKYENIMSDIATLHNNY